MYLSVAPALPIQPGTASPLAGHTLLLLKDRFDVLAKGGFPAPAGVAPFKAATSLNCAVASDHFSGSRFLVMPG